MSKKILIMIVVVCLAAAGLVWGASLDTQGQGAWCEIKYVNIVAAGVKMATPEKSVYTFTGRYRYQAVGAAACPPETMEAAGTGEWHPATKTAIENISTPYQGGATFRTVNTCSDNPWLNANVQCTLVSKDPPNWTDPKGPFPISAHLLTAGQRQALKTEEQQKYIFVQTPPAPTILNPTANQLFMVPAHVPIKVQHPANFSVVFEFEWRSKKPKPGEWPDVYKTMEGIVLDQQQTTNGLTTGQLTMGKTGQWRFRARCALPGAPWSEWREFVVDKLLTPAPMQIQQKPIKKFDMK